MRKKITQATEGSNRVRPSSIRHRHKQTPCMARAGTPWPPSCPHHRSCPFPRPRAPCSGWAGYGNGAIDLDNGETCPTPNWLSLQLGVVESLSGTHALVLHKEQWSGPKRRQTYERDMSQQIATFLALDWRELASFRLDSWFGIDSGLAALHTLNGMTGMIVSVAGQALGIGVPQTVLHKSDALLARIVEQWQADDETFMPLAFELADRHLMQCRLDTDHSLFDFDHPVEQTIPVELLVAEQLITLGWDPWWSATDARRYRLLNMDTSMRS